jgi:hypothetical protein
VVADLADHHYVGVVPQGAAQGLGEADPLAVDLDLVDPFERYLDRILDR